MNHFTGCLINVNFHLWQYFKYHCLHVFCHSTVTCEKCKVQEPICSALSPPKMRSRKHRVSYPSPPPPEQKRENISMIKLWDCNAWQDSCNSVKACDTCIEQASEGTPKTTAVAGDMAKVLGYIRMRNNTKYAVGLLGKLVVPFLLEHQSLIQNMKTTVMKKTRWKKKSKLVGGGFVDWTTCSHSQYLC